MHPQLAERIQMQVVSDSMDWASHWPWTAEAEPDLADYLSRNERPLAVVIEATRRPQYYNPLVPKMSEDCSAGLLTAIVSSVQKCRELAHALTSRAMLRVAQGKTDEAWQDLLACHRLGRLVARGATMIEMLVGIAIEQIANTSDIVFLDHAKLPSPQILVCRQDLEKLPPMPALADKIDLGERFMLLD